MLLQQLQRYSGTCLGIGKSVMVFCQVVSAISRHSVQLMVGQHALELPARRAACAIELIFRIVHDIFLKHRPQTALVKLTVVSHQRQPLDKRLYLAPHIWKFRCVSHILQCQPMHPCVPIREEVGMRINKAVELVGNLSVSHHNHSHAAHTAVALVGCLKIYRCKILHSLCLQRRHMLSLEKKHLRHVLSQSYKMTAPFHDSNATFFMPESVIPVFFVISPYKNRLLCSNSRI